MSDLLAARSQMAMSLAFHIVFAAIGIAMPLLMVVSEWFYLRTREEVYLTLAKRWAEGTRRALSLPLGLTSSYHHSHLRHHNLLVSLETRLPSRAPIRRRAANPHTLGMGTRTVPLHRRAQHHHLFRRRPTRHPPLPPRRPHPGCTPSLPLLLLPLPSLQRRNRIHGPPRNLRPNPRQQHPQPQPRQPSTTIKKP